MRTIRIVTRAAAVLLAAVMLAGCPAAPRVRPVKMGPAGTGPGSLDAARRQLEGKWELVSYQLVAPDGKATPVTGVGTLTLDAFGNLSLDAHAETKTGKMLPMSMQGRIVIDPQTQSFALADIDASGQPLPSAQVSPDKRRFYAFQGDLLQLEIRDAAGKPTGRSSWRKLE